MNRVAALPIIGSALLSACATTPNDATSADVAESVPRPALVTAAGAPADTLPVADVTTVDIEELDSGLVCESKRRPGSRIAATVCYTREQHAAAEKEQADAARQYARDLDRERATREQQIRNGDQRPASIIVFQ